MWNFLLKTWTLTLTFPHPTNIYTYGYGVLNVEKRVWILITSTNKIFLSLNNRFGWDNYQIEKLGRLKKSEWDDYQNSKICIWLFRLLFVLFIIKKKNKRLLFVLKFCIFHVLVTLIIENMIPQLGPHKICSHSFKIPRSYIWSMALPKQKIKFY